MPGLSVWLPGLDQDDTNVRFKRAQDLVVRAPSDVTGIAFESASVIVGHAGHHGYPVRSWRGPSGTILFEGRMYDRPDTELDRQLAALFETAFDTPSPEEVISRFVASADGDYLVVGVTSAGDRVIAFSDALGRLPAYFHDSRIGLVLTRECKVITSLRNEWAFDRFGIAQQFWLGYPLGGRMLFDGIERMPEAFVLDLRRGDRGIEARRGTTWSYRCDQTAGPGGLDRAAAEVAERFAIAARARGAVEDTHAVISASGGSDSRAVMAALAADRGRAPGGSPSSGPGSPVAVTFRRANGAQSADVRVAEQVARALGLPWDVIEVPLPDPAGESALVWMKDAMNGVGMAFILPFLAEIVRRWTDRAVILTGDGGDKIFPDLRPASRPRSIEAAAQAIIDEASYMEAGSVERLLDLPAGSLMDDLCRRLEAFPEESPESKVVRFQIAERARKWLFEGEDRTRCVAWAATPFYALPVFEAAMAVPGAAKKDDRFYADVQRRLNPILVEIPHADFGLSITSRRFYARQAARRLALRTIGPSARPLLRRSNRAATAPADATASTMALLDEATSGRSTLELVDSAAARAAIAVSSAPTLGVWRTLLLVDRLWRERITTGVQATPGR